jgi:thiol-disulfide isomerase/thioredoxin
MKKNLFNKSNIIYALILSILLFKVTQTSISSFKQEGIILTSLELQDIEGNSIIFPSEMKRNKDVVVIFWATWCGPCHAQMKIMDSLITDEEAKKKIIAISLGEDLKTVKRFLKKSPLPFKVFVDTKRKGWQHFGISATPSMLILSKENKVSYFTSGISPLFPIRVLLNSDTN